MELHRRIVKRFSYRHNSSKLLYVNELINRLETRKRELCSNDIMKMALMENNYPNTFQQTLEEIIIVKHYIQKISLFSDTLSEKSLHP